MLLRAASHFESHEHQNMVIAIQERFFFEHYGLTNHDLEIYLTAALSAGGDYADLYFEYLTSTSIRVDESIVKSASQGISAGCGVRVVSGERTGYAYTDDLAPEKILRAARTAALIARGPAKSPVQGFTENANHQLYPIASPSADADIAAKLELVMRADRSARAYDPRMVGKRVAAGQCTVVDTATLPSRRGSINVDDEGSPTHNTVLIEKGILKGYLSDKLSARLMGVPDTGNGRRESYAHIPMPRMTNTYMLEGEEDPQDIIRSVKHGVYAVNFGGGQVDITSGKFVFSASEAYLIEDGQVTAPIKGATLIGNGPDVLTRVSMVGNDLKLDEGVGTCGKDGQAVPVGVGIPTLKVDRLTVGGTAKKDTGGFMQ